MNAYNQRAVSREVWKVESEIWSWAAICAVIAHLIMVATNWSIQSRQFPSLVVACIAAILTVAFACHSRRRFLLEPELRSDEIQRQREWARFCIMTTMTWTAGIVVQGALYSFG